MKLFINYLTIRNISYLNYCIMTFLLASSVYADDQQIISKILELHPEIQKYELQLKSKFADSRHADTYPDPKLGLSYKNYPYYGSPFKWDANRIGTPTMTGAEYTISQEIPFPGKLAGQKDQKNLEAKEFLHQIGWSKNRLVGSLFSTLIQLEFIDKKKEHLISIEKLSSSLKRVASSRYIAGKDELNLTGENFINSIESKEKITDLETDKVSLEASLEYFTIQNQISKEEILKINYKKFLLPIEAFSLELESIPEIQIAKATLEKNRTQEKLESLTHYPDMEIYFAYMKRNVRPFVVDTGSIATAMGNWQIMDQTEFRGDLISMGITVRIPVWSIGKNKDLNQKNHFSVEAAKKEIEQKEKSYKTELLKIIATVKGIDKKIDLMEKHHIPALHTNIKSQGANYQTGKMGFSEITKSQIDLLTIRYNLEDLKEKKYLLLLTLSEITGKLAN